ncbi:MAG: hypothetical protein LBD43_01295 [Holosporales bacterium]|jgi:hypothetical protein|nr:hypothetical protein [Holosporales bacterium]
MRDDGTSFYTQCASIDWGQIAIIALHYGASRQNVNPVFTRDTGLTGVTYSLGGETMDSTALQGTIDVPVKGWLTTEVDNLGSSTR